MTLSSQPAQRSPEPAAGGPLAEAETGRPTPPREGRAKKAAADLRTTQIQIRMTPREKARIEHEAQEAGRSASDYLRRRGLGQPVVARADVAAEQTLKRIGSNLNQLARRANASGAAGLETEVSAALAELRAAVGALVQATS